jgi:hypothetical protein
VHANCVDLEAKTKTATAVTSPTTKKLIIIQLIADTVDHLVSYHNRCKIVGVIVGLFLS